MSTEITSDKFDRSCVEIDLAALRHNYNEIRRITSPDTEIMAVVKADAYGHGAVRCAKALIDCGASYLCVATIGEAVELRKWAFASDYIRLYAISTEGGIYLDSDVYLYQNFDRFLDHRYFTNIEFTYNE